MNTQEDMTTSSKSATRPRHLIPEQTYDYGHPEVVYWTKTLGDRAKKSEVLANVDGALKYAASRTTAETVGRVWYDFSRHVPIFLMRAAAQTNDPERQHHLIQIAYDELGGRDKNLIHSKLFAEALFAIGIQLPPGSPVSAIGSVLDTLDASLAAAASDEGLLGLLLSFEIVAEGNIEKLFQCLSFDDAARATLSKTQFFEIHRQDETEHIRHAVANFLRFCKTKGQCEDFMRSFDDGIKFWQRFWDQAARLINAGTDTCADAA